MIPGMDEVVEYIKKLELENKKLANEVAQKEEENTKLNERQHIQSINYNNMNKKTKELYKQIRDLNKKIRELSKASQKN